MQIKIVSVAIFLLILLTAGCASTNDQWKQDTTAADSSVAEQSQPMDSGMDSNMEKKSSKGMWEEGSKY